jgi:hypothetical protein
VDGLAGDGSGNQDIALGEYNTSGTLVSTFGTGGITLTPDGSDAAGNAIDVSGNFIWVAGSGNSQTAFLARYNSNGTLTKITTAGVGSGSTWTSMATASNGEVLVAGFTNVSGTQYVALAEYNALGSLDRTFGNSGTESPKGSGV